MTWCFWFGFVYLIFHIPEVLNNKIVFTDYITQKLFRYTWNFSHFLKKKDDSWSHKLKCRRPQEEEMSFVNPRLSLSLKRVRNITHILETELSSSRNNAHQTQLRYTADTDPPQKSLVSAECFHSF